MERAACGGAAGWPRHNNLLSTPARWFSTCMTPPPNSSFGLGGYPRPSISANQGKKQKNLDKAMDNLLKNYPIGGTPFLNLLEATDS